MTVEQGSSYVEAGAIADGGETVTLTGTVDDKHSWYYTLLTQLPMQLAILELQLEQ